MKYFSKFLLILFGFFLSIGVLEIIFRTIIPASEMPFYAYDREYNIRKFNRENGVEGLRTIGVFAQTKAQWRINNHGWNSAVDYRFEKDSTKKRIAIIGDSFIEGLHVNTNENVGHILNNLLGNDNYEVYTFGQSGWPASTYLQINRYVNKYYKPDFVIVLLVHNDFDESFIGIGDSYHTLIRIDEVIDSVVEIPSVAPEYSSMVNKYKVLKKSALIRYLYYNLKVHYWLNFRLLKNDQKIEPDITNETERKIEPSLEEREETKESQLNDRNKPLNIFIKYFIESTKKINFESKYLIVMNSTICRGGSEQSPKNIYYSKLVADIISTDSVNYLDLTKAFSLSYQQTKVNNCTSFFDSHWGKQGHRVAAETIYDYINSHNIIP